MTKMMISSENAGKITMEGCFPWVVCRKDVDILDIAVLEVNW